MGRRYALCLDSLSSHFFDFPRYKLWKQTKSPDDVVFVDSTSLSNVTLYYFTPSTTSTSQPLDMGSFLFIQSAYRKWINNYLIMHNKLPKKFKMVEKTYELMENLPRNIILASFRRTAVKVSLNLRVIKPTRLAVSKNRKQ